MAGADGIVERILEHGIVAILRGIPLERVAPVADALYEGGIRLIECTFDHAEEGFLERCARSISILRDRAEGFAAVGAGTVLTAGEARIAVGAGAELIISPNADAEVIRESVRLGAVSIPGALTPTEIALAHSAGAHFVKLFPADAHGPAYLKAIRAPLKHVRFLAVGGISRENMADYLKAGAVGFGVSSPLLPMGEILKGNYGAVRALAEGFARAFREAAATKKTGTP